MGVASCRSTFLCLMLRVRLVLFRISIRDLILFSGRARRGFRSAKWLGPAQPSPARPCVPLAPTPPHAPPSLSHLDFPRNNLPLPLPPLSPRGALGIGDGDHRNLDPEVSSPPLLSLSLSLLFFPAPRTPSFSPARARSCPSRSSAARPRLAPSLPATARGGPASPPPCPRRRAVAPPRPCPRRRPCPPRSPVARPCPPLPAAPAPCSPGAASGPRRIGPGVAPAPAPAPSAASAPCARRPGPWRGSRGLGVASRSPVYR
jgi:hypothetical protein